jgi:hypothetical protein
MRFVFYATGIVRASDKAAAKIFLMELLSADNIQLSLPMSIDKRPLEMYEVDVVPVQERVEEEKETEIKE